MSDNSQPSTSRGDPETVVGTQEGNADQEVTRSNVACCCDLSTRKFASLAFSAFVFISAVIFLVAANVETDKHGIHISRLPVYRYLTVVLVISVIWMLTFIISEHCAARPGWLASHIEPKKSLLPTHLLVGVMFFGLGSSFLTMVELLQFIAEYDCPRKDLTMLFYYVVRTIFIYTQLYFFYKLSCKSEKVLIFGHFLTMHLIAVNLGTWIVTFVYDSAEELTEIAENENSTMLFMARHWGNDLVESKTKKCSETVDALKSTAEKMEPYLYTFTMEYCLISAGLMFNTWLSLRTSMETADPQSENHVVAETGHTSSDRDDSGRNHITSVSSRQNNDHRRQKSVNYRGKERQRSTESYGAISSTSDRDSYLMIESHKSGEEVGTLWRFGFILGLAYVPVFVAIILNLFFTDDQKQDRLIYIGMQFFFFLSIFVASSIGVHQCGKIVPVLKKEKKKESDGQVDFILLAVSLVGVLFLDFLIIIASICEMSDHRDIAASLILTNTMEVICSIIFTLFVRKALGPKLEPENIEPENIDQDYYGVVTDSASRIREVVSFLFMLNICFWGMYTFEVKKSGKVLEVVEQFYTEKVWFYLSHFVYPLAVFFHFHGAVCMFEVLEHYSISKAPTREGSAASASVSILASSTVA